MARNRPRDGADVKRNGRSRLEKAPKHETYLETFVKEKGVDLDSEVGLEGHINLTYRMVIDFVASQPRKVQTEVRTMMMRIDFVNGDWKGFFLHITQGMILSYGHPID